MKFGKKEIIIFVLLFCIIGRLAISLFPFDGRYFYGCDHYCHIHNVETIAEKGLINWDYSWYGGSPFMQFYPPLSLWMGGLLANIIGGLDAYKLILLLAFSLTPVAAYLFFKEFFKKTKEVLFSTVSFSFTVYYAWMANIGQFPMIFSMLLALLFLTSFIRYLKYNRTINFVVASILLGLIAFSHLIVTYISILLSFIYLLTFFADKRFELKKFVSGFGIYFIGFLIAAFWLIPVAFEYKYTSFAIRDSELPLFSIPIVNFLKVYTYDIYFSFIPIVTTIICGILLLYGAKRSLKWNSDNVFLLTSLALFVATYFSLYSLLPFTYFAFGRWMTFMPVITTILITKALDKKILAYLASIFLMSQIIFFFIVPMSSFDMEPQKKVAEYLSDKDGRVIYVAAIKPNSDLDTAFDYLIPKYNSEYAIGFWPQGQSSKRYSLSLDIGMYVCEGVPEPPNLLDFSIRKTNPAKEGLKCTVRKNSSDELLRLQNIRYVIINNQFPDILSRFENDSNFTRIKQIDNFTIMELNNSVYIRTDPRVEWNYTKETDRIEIDLSSKERLYNVSVMISESWYPNWKSQEVSIEPNELDFMTFKLSELEGNKHITIEFVRPFYYRIGEWITLLALIGIVSLTAVKWGQPLIQNKTKRK